MSIYSRSVSDLSTDHLAALLTEGAIENIRLEFKTEMPDKTEFLKKVSAFANTYGGLLIIGANAGSKDGRLISLPGIAPIQGLKQRIVQWSFEGLAPPLEVFSSDPIPCPAGAQKVCYVISVPESQTAPHFINGRRGVYVRTDEFSSRFEAQLANYEELKHLLNRRELAVSRRCDLLVRAEERFARVVALRRSQHTGKASSLGPTLALFASPLYPSRPLQTDQRLLENLRGSRVEWRQLGFPNTSEPVSQHESILLLNAATGLSILEATIWGSLYYAADVVNSDGPDQAINLYRLIGYLLVFLDYAGSYYATIGFDGLLFLSVQLSDILNVPLGSREGGTRRGSPIDSRVSFDITAVSDRVKNDRDGLTADLLKILFFALNWHDVTNNDTHIRTYLSCGYEYNEWQLPGS